MIKGLNATVIGTKDLLDQGDSTHIFATGKSPNGMLQGYAVDRIKVVGDKLVEGWRGDELIICCHLEASWNLINRSVLVFHTQEEAIRHISAVAKETGNLAKDMGLEISLEEAQEQSKAGYL